MDKAGFGWLGFVGGGRCR